jgi:EmrB/QacA subfamily drug resistance transporter
VTSGVEEGIDSGALRRSRFFSLFPSIMLPMSLAVVDQTIVASALPAIAASLGEVERISWVVIAYLVANTIAAPVYGYVGDVFGRRRLMFMALALFIIASVLCALAPSIPLLAAARMLQGLGGGGLMTLSQALVGQVVPPRERGHYQGYLATMATVASAIGPVIGGFLTESFGWQWIFLINVPLGLIAIVLVMRLPAKPGTSQQDWQFDVPGLFFYVAFIVPILIALQEVQHLDAHSLWTAVALFGLSIVALVLLIRREGRAKAPLLPLDLIRQPAIWRANALAVCHGAALTALIAFLPIYFRVVDGTSASETGYLLLPVTAGLGIGSIIIGRVVTRTGKTMIFPSVGLIGASLILAFFALASTRMSATEISFTIGAAMLFMGTVMGVVQITVQGSAGHRLGSAAATVQLARAVGASFGTAIVGTILFASLAATDSEAARLFGRAVDVGPDALMQLGEAQRAVVAAEIGNAFRAAFGILAVFTACGMVLAWSNPSRRI